MLIKRKRKRKKILEEQKKLKLEKLKQIFQERAEF